MIAAWRAAAHVWLKCTEEESMNPTALNEELPRPALLSAVRHGLMWLVLANAVGVLLALLLLFPMLAQPLGEWTYGRWVMVHMNLELYGWTALPLLGFLFHTYGAGARFSAWARPAVWLWSAALAVGCAGWLSGATSGKLFLDWSGFARLLFVLALTGLWLQLATAFLANAEIHLRQGRVALFLKLAGLLVLALVPWGMYRAADPNLYPAFNPDTGGPTGTSQLESTLGVTAIALLLPLAIASRRTGRRAIMFFAWSLLIAEALLCAAMSHADVGHREPSQYLGLGVVLLWIPIVPSYFSAFSWNANTRPWRLATLWWWAALLLTGWLFFLPGVLDYFKFTDGLVGHSFVAMAGFTSSLIILVSVQLLGEHGWIFNRRRSFWLWQFSVIAYIALMTAGGWMEGADPAFTIVPGPMRNLIYALRLLTGVLMLAVSLDWLRDSRALRFTDLPSRKKLQEAA
jgi:cytochrome c oxidase cbb3-type subunit 1